MYVQEVDSVSGGAGIAPSSLLDSENRSKLTSARRNLTQVENMHLKRNLIYTYTLLTDVRYQV